MASAAASAAAAAAARHHVLLPARYHAAPPSAAPASASARCVLRSVGRGRTPRYGTTGRRRRRRRFRAPRAGMDMDLASGAVEVINDLGFDTLTYLGVTVFVVPAFRVVKASPILGFFCAGVVLNQFGLIRNLTDVKLLSEWGILFLLFEMGLELSLSRLRALARYAFGVGLPQVLLSTLAFTAFELPPNDAIGTKILQFLFDSRPDLVNIRSIDEAIVIGAALSLSSSAFVLQLLAEKGELPTRFGSATLGILLLQDIAVVPLLVILPVLESQKPAEMVNYGSTEPVVILGFGEMGQVLARFLSAPLSFGIQKDTEGWPYVAFELNPAVVKSARKSGFPVLYGDGSRPAVLQSAGITFPKAIMVMYTGKEKTIESVNRLRQAFAVVPIYARAQDLSHLLDLKKAGATDVVLENAETSLQLGSILLKGLGVMSDDVSFLSKLVRDSMELQAQEALKDIGDQEVDTMKPLQVRASDLVDRNGTSSRMVAQEQSLSLSSRPDINPIKPSMENRISDMKVENENPGYDFDRVDSEDGMTYCVLESDDESDEASSTSNKQGND